MQGLFLGTKSARTRLALAFSFLIIPTLFLVAALPPTSSATQEGTQSGVNRKNPRPEFVPGEALVRYRGERAARRQTQQKQHAMLSADGRQLSITIERLEGLEIVPGLRLARMAPEDTMAAIEALKKQPDVLYAEPNYLLHLDRDPNDPRFTSGELFGLTKIGAPTAWNTTTGSSSVVVGVIDEGIDKNHQDLAANIWINLAEANGTAGVDDDGNGFIDDVNGYNFASNTGTIPAEFHASHVAGTIGAVGHNMTGVVGVNWQVSLMSLRFISGSSGSTANAIRACNYSRQMHDLWVSTNGMKGANVRVLNNSYGGGGFSQSFLDAINGLNQSAILFVASAGNVSPGSSEPNNEIVPHYPSSYLAPNVIGVANTDSSDNLAGSSHFGLTTIQLGAPGSGILSTTPGNNYELLSGTSMATPHVAGAAALLLAQNPNLTVQQLKSLLIFNGDPVPSLAGKTLTGRRLNIANSMQALNDTTPPGTVTSFHINSQVGRALNVGWTASGDDGAVGQAALYELTFTDVTTGTVILLKRIIPAASGVTEAVDVKLPYRHTSGTLMLREFDNSGNEGTPASFNVSVSFAEGDPYAMARGVPAALSTGGTPLGLIGDDKLKLNHPLGLTFPFFGQNFMTVNVSTNGNLFFSTPPTRSNGDAADVPSSTVALAKFKAISGMWDDIRTDSADPLTPCTGCDVFMVSPDPSRVIFRWKGVTFGAGTVATQFPVNFEIELRTDGTIKSRYGVGQSAPINTNLFPVVGIAGGEPDAYVVTALTSENTLTNLTNALSVTYLPRGVVNPLGNSDFYVDQHYSDFLNRIPDVPGLGFWTNQINECGTDQACIEIRRINVSAAFFLSIEFLETGYLVERMYKAAYADSTGTSTFGCPSACSGNPTHQLSVPIVRRSSEFLPDTLQMSNGVVVGVTGWETVLENNKVAFANDFVSRARFTTAYPTSLTPTEFVNTLNTNAGNPLSQAERDQLVSDLTLGAKTRAQVLRAVAEDPDLFNAEKNRAFVLMQYLGYLRRDPNVGPDTDYTGYDFWLTKLNQFGGNFVNAEMVKAFIVSGEYRQRFGP